MKIEVYNIEYDTVDRQGVERRAEIDPNEIPSNMMLLAPPQIDKIPSFEDWLLFKVENTWLVNRFDYRIEGLPPRVGHVECQARTVAGVPTPGHSVPLGPITVFGLFN